MSEDPVIVRAYRRILKAAEEGRGVRLSAEEVARMSMDTAINQVVWTHDDEEYENDELR